jgi:hypothetical protein
MRGMIKLTIIPSTIKMYREVACMIKVTTTGSKGSVDEIEIVQ